jgi:hypothetical protein
MAIKSMDLYVCYGTYGTPDSHRCAHAMEVLTGAGHHPRVVRTYGGLGADRLSKGRRELKRLTGDLNVPILVLGDGTIVEGCAQIVAWTDANPRDLSPRAPRGGQT